jgi:hypothetical protein
MKRHVVRTKILQRHSENMKIIKVQKELDRKEQLKSFMESKLIPDFSDQHSRFIGGNKGNEEKKP